MAAAIGDCGLVSEIVELMVAGRPLQPCIEPSVNAVLAECTGDEASAVAFYEDAATRWQGLGVPHEHGLARLGQGRCLTALGRAGDAAPALDEAAQILTALGAGPALAEARALRETGAGPVRP